MARRGDGIYQRGPTWWLDFTHEGQRHIARLGKGINWTVAGEIARVKRAAVLKGEAGIGRKRKDLGFDKAAEQLLEWAKAEKRPKTATSYGENITQLKRSFAGRRLSEISAFTVEKHKRMRLDEGARVAPNRELSILRLLFNRCLAAGVYEGPNPVAKVIDPIFQSYDLPTRWWHGEAECMLPMCDQELRLGRIRDEDAQAAEWRAMVRAAADQWQIVADQWQIVRIPRLMDPDSIEYSEWERFCRAEHERGERAEYDRLKRKYGDLD